MAASNQNALSYDRTVTNIRDRDVGSISLKEAVAECRQRMNGVEFRAIADLLRRCGEGPSFCQQILAAVNDSIESQRSIAELKGRIEKLEPEITARGAFEQYLLIAGAVRIADSIRHLPVATGVKQLYADEFMLFAHPGLENRWMFQVGQYRFAEMCRVASLRRFPAGQLHWEVAGFARRNLLRVSPFHLARLLHFIATNLGGFRPWFCAHLNGRRRNNLWLLESEQNRAYYLMAKSMALQPIIRGMVIASWLHSPETHKITPHLAWLNKPFVENGGIIVDLGEDDPEGGALVGSRVRKELWEKGEFVPRIAAALWPRDAMLRWAARHPEFEL